MAIFTWCLSEFYVNYVLQYTQTLLCQPCGFTLEQAEKKYSLMFTPKLIFKITTKHHCVFSLEK